MAIDDDPLLVTSRQFATENSTDSETVRDVVLRILAQRCVPIVGDIILGSVNELAHKRWKGRVADLLEKFAEQLLRIRDRIPDVCYFGSEDFQSILLEAIDQQRANRFEEKRRMLASGLARSGTSEFAADNDKEAFVRLLRDLSLGDIESLQRLKPDRERAMINGPARIVVSQENDNSTLNRLQGLGLASSVFQMKAKDVPNVTSIRTQKDVNRAVASVLAGTPTSVFSITKFGIRFLRFLENTNDPDNREEQRKPAAQG